MTENILSMMLDSSTEVFYEKKVQSGLTALEYYWKLEKVFMHAVVNDAF
jgi:hypothetical protein